MRTLTYLKDCRVHTKQKRIQKANLQNASTFTGNESHSHQVTYIDAYINFISVTCSPHNAKTTIGRYQHTNRFIPIIGKMADNQPIPISDRLSVHL